MHWELIHAEEKDGFVIRFYAAPETQDPVGAFADDGETAAAIREGRFEWFIAKVTASRNDIELADDYLGGCCYEFVMDFVREDGYYADMCQTVIAEARATIRKLTAIN